MAKKRKAPRNTEPAGPREVDPNEARLTIKTYEDVMDSEEEYWHKKDQIDLEDEPRSKRPRRQEKEDAFLEASDEEVFEEDESDEEEEEEYQEEEEEEEAAPAKGKKKTAHADDLSDDDLGGRRQADEEEGDEGWWGASKKEYYDADQIETEADALAEEAEAKRIQAKKLAKMSEADFAFDESEWLTAKDEKTAGDEDVVTEVLVDAEVTDDMGPEERYKLLQARYPEFDYLVDEFRDLQPRLAELQKEAEGKVAKSLEVAKFWVLGSYVASLASYFAILTSPARDEDGSAKTLSPAELRDHDVMETLMKCREAWLKVKDLKARKAVKPSTGMLSPPEEEEEELSDVSMEEAPVVESKKAQAKRAKANERKAAEKAKKAKAVEKSLADLSTLLTTAKPSSKKEARSATAEGGDDDDNRSDFGDEEVLDARTAAAKASRKKSLKFYTSQIVQKSNKRADAGRDAGGDMDIPYRERLVSCAYFLVMHRGRTTILTIQQRDRQARLNALAEKRGKKDGKGADLDGADSDDEGDKATARQVRDGGDDEYYDLVAHRAAAKKAEKEARFKAIADAKGQRVVETEEVGEDGKRKISYQIDKNKGLAPKRKKENRNPRVKKRMMFEAKQKKLKSVKAVYKGGEGKGGYQGELSGIKTGLVKSTKL